MHESIELQMSLLLAVALAGHLLSALLRQPAVVGQILAGLIVGPSVLGWITYTTFVANIAHLGAIVLLFVVGLEFRAKDLAAARPFVIAVAGIVLPWFTGYLIARGFGFDTSRALLIGVALSATSIAITADTLRELGRLQSSEAKLIIGAAVIDDVLALLALSLVDQLGSGNIEPFSIALMAAKAILFIGVGCGSGK
jgi:Kef-type K+ transport system membrane component KefB